MGLYPFEHDLCRKTGIGLVTLPSRNARCYGSCHEQEGLVTLPNGKVGATDLGMSKNTYRGHRFPPAIIQLTVWMYARFTLSLRDVEELLAERGLDISYETVRRWFLKFGKSMPAASDMGDIDQRIAGISTRW